MANMNTSPLLDLKTKIERKHIVIDSKSYPLRSLSEFSLLERHEIAVAGKVMQGITKMGEEGPAATEAITKARVGLDATVERLLIEPGDIISKLKDEQKLQIINCFFEQAGLRPENQSLRPQNPQLEKKAKRMSELKEKKTVLTKPSE